MPIRMLPGKLWRRYCPKWGHAPGAVDVRSHGFGYPFSARFNFRCCNVKGRPYGLPLWGPLYPQPANNAVKGHTINKHWPHEAVWKHWLSPVFPSSGNWVQVAGQVLGEVLHDEAGHWSGLWNVVLVPLHQFRRRARRFGHEYQQVTRNGQTFFVTYASDLWMGNTGWHGIPYQPESRR